MPAFLSPSLLALSSYSLSSLRILVSPTLPLLSDSFHLSPSLGYLLPKTQQTRYPPRIHGLTTVIPIPLFFQPVVAHRMFSVLTTTTCLFFHVTSIFTRPRHHVQVQIPAPWPTYSPHTPSMATLTTFTFPLPLIGPTDANS